MKRKSLILTLVIALLFTLALVAQAKPYTCKLCGSTNVDSVYLYKYTELTYKPCTCNAKGGVSNQYDEYETSYWRVKDHCYDCNQTYYYNTANYSIFIKHVGAIPK